MASAAGELAIETRTRGFSQHSSVSTSGSIFFSSNQTPFLDSYLRDNEALQTDSRHALVAPKDSDLSLSETRWCSAAFLMIGVGVAMCWTMLQCGISYFEGRYAMGTKFYLAMVAAYNVPVLPLLLLQAALDRKYDVKYGAELTFQFRFMTGFLFLCGILCAIPFVEEYACLMFVVFAGVMDSVAFGSAAQLFSMFPPRCGGYYFIGASLTSVLSLAITVGSGFAREDPPSRSSVCVTYFLSAVVVALGLAATLILVRSDVGRRLLRDKTKLDMEESQRDVPVRDLSSSLSNGEEALAAGNPERTGKTNRELFFHTLQAHIALGLTWLLSTFVGSLVSLVPSQHHSSSLKLILVYVGMFSSLLGKQINALPIKLISSQHQLLTCTVVLGIYSLFYLFYIIQGRLRSDIEGQQSYYFTLDWLIIPYVALFNIAAAYFSSQSYSMAARLIAAPSDKAQNSALLGLTLMGGVYIGLGASFAVSAAVPPPPS
jgi:hypothetical protein